MPLVYIPLDIRLKIPQFEEIHVTSSEIVQMLTFFGRELPRGLVCVLVKKCCAKKICQKFRSTSDGASSMLCNTSSISFSPAKDNLATKFIVMFPTDESSQQLQSIGNEIFNLVSTFT